MLAKTPRSKICELLDELVDLMGPCPQFPEAFGPRNRSPNVNHYGRIYSAEHAVAEADRVIAKRRGAK